MTESRKRPDSTVPPVSGSTTLRTRAPTTDGAGMPAISRTVTPKDLCASTVARTSPPHAPSVHPIGTPPGGSSPMSLAVAGWLRDRGIYPAAGKHWRVQIAFEVNDRPASFGFAATKLLVTIEPNSWGYAFTHGDRTSTIHVTTYPTARDGDDHRLLGMTPALKRFGSLVRDLEARYRIFFPRHHAAIRSDLQGGEPMIRAWISSL